MNNEIQTFQFNNHALRMLVDENGEPWFVAKDVADILGYKDTEAMTRKLDDDEKSNLRSVGLKPGKGYSDSIDGLGPKVGGRGTLLINESGLYSAILTCQKPQAKPFKRRVTHEILPSIRKHGYYVQDSKKQTYHNFIKQSPEKEPFQRLHPTVLAELRRLSPALAQSYLVSCGVTPDYIQHQLEKADGIPMLDEYTEKPKPYRTDFYRDDDEEDDYPRPVQTLTTQELASGFVKDWHSGALGAPVIPCFGDQLQSLFSCWAEKEGVVYTDSSYTISQEIYQQPGMIREKAFVDSEQKEERVIAMIEGINKPEDVPFYEYINDCNQKISQFINEAYASKKAA